MKRTRKSEAAETKVRIPQGNAGSGGWVRKGGWAKASRLEEGRS